MNDLQTEKEEVMSDKVREAAREVLRQFAIHGQPHEHSPWHRELEAALSSPAEGTFREGVEAAARIVELTPSLVRAVIARQIRALSPAPTGCCLVAHHTGGREHDPYCKTPAAPKATT